MGVEQGTDGAGQTCILIVEPDPAARSILSEGLRAKGVSLLAAESMAQARVVLDEPFEAVILDPDLPDGPGEDLVPELLERLPPSRIIVHSSDHHIDGLPAVCRCDVDAVYRLLALDQGGDRPPVAVQARRAVGRVHRQWLELCRWDPSLPPDVRPPVAEAVIKAVAEALARPQPLGWGIDPATDPVAGVFGLNVGDVRVALAELVCLREAFTRVVIPTLESDQVESLRRLHMIIDRTMMAVVDAGLERLTRHAYTDELTGLGNRRAFEQDLAREVHRSQRSGTPITVAMMDLDHLKQTNDTLGHPAGDHLLRQTARSLRRGLRRSDRIYRIGGDEFAAILVDTSDVHSHLLIKRLQDAGSPSFSVGTASSPPDPTDRLVVLADIRLYEAKALRHRQGGSGPAPQP